MMRHRHRARHQPRFSTLPLVLLGLVALSFLGLLYLLGRMLFASKPQITLESPFEVVGREAPLVLRIQDKQGLKSVRVAVQQGGQEHVVREETYEPPRKEVELRWTPAQDKSFKLSEGPGRLVVSARNDSWGNFLKGRTAKLEKDFTARLVPPRLEVLTTQHYVNQGGCDMVVYKVTPTSVRSGVMVGEQFFVGFPLPGAKEPATHFAIFCFPYDAKPDVQVRLKANDEAYNRSLASFWLKMFPQRFRSRELPLDEAFMSKVVPEIMSQTPSLTDQGDLLKNYLQINRDLRQANNKALAELTASSRAQFLWSEPFQQLGSSQVEAQFADHRTYTYQGREVDRQTHLGFDLATTANAPVTAANDGVVALAEFLGIYGNTVVIDHGYGLMSLYGHLSSFAVNKGDTVKRGQGIGRSGATGLAGGDHLHFSMLYQEVQVDPREWWDRHWLQDRIAAKLVQFGDGGGPGRLAAAPAASPSPAASAAPLAR